MKLHLSVTAIGEVTGETDDTGTDGELLGTTSGLDGTTAAVCDGSTAFSLGWMADCSCLLSISTVMSSKGSALSTRKILHS